MLLWDTNGESNSQGVPAILRTMGSPRIYKWWAPKQVACCKMFYLNPVEAYFLSSFPQSQSLPLVFYLASALVHSDSGLGIWFEPHLPSPLLLQGNKQWWPASALFWIPISSLPLKSFAPAITPPFSCFMNHTIFLIAFVFITSRHFSIISIVL